MAKSPQPGGRPGFGAFSGPVPVRVTAVKQGEFEVFYKSLGTVTPLNTVNVRSRVGGELVEVRFEEGAVGAVHSHPHLQNRAFQLLLPQKSHHIFLVVLLYQHP